MIGNCNGLMMWKLVACAVTAIVSAVINYSARGVETGLESGVLSSDWATGPEKGLDTKDEQFSKELCELKSKAEEDSHARRLGDPLPAQLVRDFLGFGVRGGYLPNYCRTSY